jgi:hypothetical protein
VIGEPAAAEIRTTDMTDAAVGRGASSSGVGAVKFVLVPVLVLMSLVAVGSLLDQLRWAAGVGAVLFVATSILGWIRQEVARG